MASNSAFTASSEDTLELFDEFVDGAPDRPVLVLCTDPCSATVREALAKSFAAMGLGGDACSFATLGGKGLQVDARALFILVEGLDPLYLVCIDDEVVERIAEAYRTSYQLDAPARVFGRSSVMFRSMDDLLSTEKGKRTIWELLKTLPIR